MVFHALFRQECFVVLVWDNAAVYDETFHAMALQLEILEKDKDQVMGINVIMDERANASPSDVTQDYRYIMWFQEPDPNDIDKLAKKIKDITQSKHMPLTHEIPNEWLYCRYIISPNTYFP